MTVEELKEQADGTDDQTIAKCWILQKTGETKETGGRPPALDISAGSCYTDFHLWITHAARGYSRATTSFLSIAI